MSKPPAGSVPTDRRDRLTRCCIVFSVFEMVQVSNTPECVQHDHCSSDLEEIIIIFDSIV